MQRKEHGAGGVGTDGASGELASAAGGLDVRGPGRTDVLKSITPAELASIPKPGSDTTPGGASAAEAAASSSSSSPELATDGLAPIPEAGGVLLLCEMVVSVTVLMQARRSKVSPKELEELKKLSPDERALLATFAPMVAPYIGAASTAAPQIAALAFCGVFGLVILSRISDVRAKAPKLEKVPTPEGAKRVDGSAATQAERLQHQRDWGQVAPSIRVGTKVVDTGEFPTRAAS